MGIMKRFGHDGAAVSKTASDDLRAEITAPPSELASQIHIVPEAPDQASVGKGMVFKGDFSGTGSLFVDGEISGKIDLPDGRVIVGPNGQVSDGLSICINARDIVVMGGIRGNITAAERVEIRAEGSLTGDVSASRISIADGAFFMGDINLRSAQPGSSPDRIEMASKVYA